MLKYVDFNDLNNFLLYFDICQIPHIKFNYWTSAYVQLHMLFLPIGLEHISNSTGLVTTTGIWSLNHQSLGITNLLNINNKSITVN